MTANQSSDPQGWRIAGLVVLLAAAMTAGAWMIHTNIYCDPRHPECTAVAGPHDAAPHDDHAAGHEMHGTPGHETHDPAHHPADSAHHKADTAHHAGKAGGN